MREMNYKYAINLLAIVTVILWLIPVIWVAINSIKPTKVINAPIPTFYSFTPTMGIIPSCSSAFSLTAQYTTAWSRWGSRL